MRSEPAPSPATELAAGPPQLAEPFAETEPVTALEIGTTEMVTPLASPTA